MMISFRGRFALLVLLSCGAVQTALAAPPWPLGTLTLNSTTDPQAPLGYQTQGFTPSPRRV
ncbi:hypothetical protein BH20VER1_BH20VER1_25540 [soil metagenome]